VDFGFKGRTLMGKRILWHEVQQIGSKWAISAGQITLWELHVEHFLDNTVCLSSSDGNRLKKVM
jgi:hypothetical protein